MAMVIQAVRILSVLLLCLSTMPLNRVSARLGERSIRRATAAASNSTTLLAVQAAYSVTPMVVGGTQVSRGNYRWLALAGTGGCAGVLVARDVVLTAAHCGNNFALGSTLRIGSTDRGTGGDTFTIEARMIHANFGVSLNKIANDLMLLRLAVPTATNYSILPINLNPLFPSNRTNLTVAGFGLTSWNGTVSPVMRQATVVQYSCQQAYQRDFDSNLTICAGSANNSVAVGTCAGDSGGPLFFDSTSSGSQVLVGITSFGADGSCGLVPSGFVRLSGHANWIRKNLCALTKYPPSYLCQ